MIISNSLGQAYLDELLLQRAEKNYSAGLCLCCFATSCREQEVLKFLHPEEIEYFRTLTFEKRKKSYLVGRYAAKQAIKISSGEQNLHAISIQPGIFNQPITTCISEQNLQVSISHCGEIGAGLAFPEAHPLAIDIEKVEAGRRELLESQLTQAEQKIMREVFISYDRALAVAWTAKEALSKVLKTGLTTPVHIFEIENVKSEIDYTISFFHHFGQYKAISFDAGIYVCSIVCPKNTEVAIGIPSIKRFFDVVAAEK